MQNMRKVKKWKNSDIVCHRCGKKVILPICATNMEKANAQIEKSDDDKDKKEKMNFQFDMKEVENKQERDDVRMQLMFAQFAFLGSKEWALRNCSRTLSR